MGCLLIVCSWYEINRISFRIKFECCCCMWLFSKRMMSKLGIYTLDLPNGLYANTVVCVCAHVCLATYGQFSNQMVPSPLGVYKAP